MKTTALSTWTVLCVSTLVTTSALRASADQAATTAVRGPEKTYVGMLEAVDRQDHNIRVKGWFLSKSFNLGDDCKYLFLNNDSGNADDLRPGQKMLVRYRNARGVLVADRLEQQPLRFEGTVKSIAPAKGELTVRTRGLDKTFQLPGDCSVRLRDDKSGALTDIQPGHHVIVTYETPGHRPTAREIAQTHDSFTGSLTAIDLTDRTVKAKGLFGSKAFHLADGCAIVLNGKTDAQLRDLKPGDKLSFSYEEVNGVNVVDRIANEASSDKLTATSR